MRRYRFAYTPPRVPGRVVFKISNGDTLVHDLVLLLIPKDVPPIDVQLRGTKRAFAPIIADLPPRSPDTTTSVAVDLAPGRYGLVCFVRDPDGQQHAQKGMAAEFRIFEP